MKRWKAIVIMGTSTLLAGGALAAVLAPQGAGTISLQFVPRQPASLIEILSMRLSPKTTSAPQLEVRNESPIAVKSMTFGALVRIGVTRGRDRWLVLSQPLSLSLEPGQISVVRATFPNFWQEDPFTTFPDGVMLTLGLAEARYADGHSWVSAVQNGLRFQADTRLTMREEAGREIGRFPRWGSQIGRAHV